MVISIMRRPRNYKWINVSQVQRIWEQMSLTYQHGVDKLWIVNVGDLKPMEYPMLFFLDMAVNPNQFTADNLREHTENGVLSSLEKNMPKNRMAWLIDTYTKYNHRITPELLNDTIYSLENYNEFQQVTSEYVKLAFLMHSDFTNKFLTKQKMLLTNWFCSPSMLAAIYTKCILPLPKQTIGQTK